MKKYEIVKEHHEFDNIIQTGEQHKNNTYIIYNKDSNHPYPRFGLAVGKKIGSAVVRNKLKRQIRMIINNNKNLFKNNQDYIIIVKRKALELDFNELEASLKDLI